MARNQEKAQSMLYRFREAQAEQLGLRPTKDKRPYVASEVDNVPEAEKWRQQVIREVARKVAKIQDVSLSEYQIRDLNDDINKSLREKRHWEDHILELGGPDYKKIGPKMLDHHGKEIPGDRGYKYFGRAKDLPGVRELLEQEVPQLPQKSRFELSKKIDADYYGYRDEDDDGTLLAFETKQEKQWAVRVQ
ncbi:Isy1-like splicing factor [Dimargaris cristalligena]|uniref:Isy1-like splicing factor n=1 Tax=Dimargaris cristalligena TaxID=215637 RepID=A0A4P9ZZU4_9FUNG|nr:Isy1-like splicing factor [Dimargaris cristalligena]|eukprot:RKP39314.1 Isy1-like splicing factor [Dimargaris cristalligena]